MAGKIVRKHIDDLLFVKTWTKVHKDGGSIHDVAEQLGCTYSGAFIKAKKLTEQGVKLPNLSKKRRLDVAGLNAVIEAELGT